MVRAAFKALLLLERLHAAPLVPASLLQGQQLPPRRYVIDDYMQDASVFAVALCEFGDDIEDRGRPVEDDGVAAFEDPRAALAQLAELALDP